MNKVIWINISCLRVEFFCIECLVKWKSSIKMTQYYTGQSISYNPLHRGVQSRKSSSSTFHLHQSFTLSGNDKRVVRVLVHVHAKTLDLFSHTPTAVHKVAWSVDNQCWAAPWGEALLCLIYDTQYARRDRADSGLSVIVCYNFQLMSQMVFPQQHLGCPGARQTGINSTCSVVSQSCPSTSRSFWVLLLCDQTCCCSPAAEHRDHECRILLVALVRVAPGALTPTSGPHGALG